MSYVPLNLCSYLKAFSGCLAGLGGSGKYLTDPNTGDFQVYARMADAFAQQLDVTWGGVAPTGFEEDAIEENCEAVWETHSPLENSKAFTPANYTALVNGVVGLVRAGSAQVAAQGVNPNGCLGGGPPGTDTVWGPTVTHASVQPHVPAAGESHTPFNTSGGTVVLETPANPQDGQEYFVKPIAPSATPATMQAVGGATIEDPTNACNFGATVDVPGQGGCVGWKYRALTTQWIGITGF